LHENAYQENETGEVTWVISSPVMSRLSESAAKRSSISTCKVQNIPPSKADQDIDSIRDFGAFRNNSELPVKHGRRRVSAQIEIKCGAREFAERQNTARTGAVEFRRISFARLWERRLGG
jgi:hypothetical protein